MPFEFDPETAYGHTYQYLPGFKEATLVRRTVGGSVVPPYHDGYARHRTKSNSDYRQWAQAFAGSVRTAQYDWFAGESESEIAKPGHLLEVDGEQWIVGQVNPGRWGSQQLLYVVELVE